MPWTPADATGHTRKARSKASRAQWSAVANKVLDKTGDEGRAVRTANGVIAKHEFSADEERAQRHGRRGR